MMNYVFYDEISQNWCLIYMDDILIIAETIEQLRERTLLILKKLQEEDLYLKPEKCHFEKQEVEYLGFVIRPNELAMDPKKLAGINDWPSPKNLRQVRSFLGFGDFY
jgi:hypothetical protein